METRIQKNKKMGKNGCWFRWNIFSGDLNGIALKIRFYHG